MGGIKNLKEKFKFVNFLAENAKYEIVIIINAINVQVSIILGSQWLCGREADSGGNCRGVKLITAVCCYRPMG